MLPAWSPYKFCLAVYVLLYYSSYIQGARECASWPFVRGREGEKGAESATEAGLERDLSLQFIQAFPAAVFPWCVAAATSLDTPAAGLYQGS